MWKSGLLAVGALLVFCMLVGGHRRVVLEGVVSSW